MILKYSVSSCTEILAYLFYVNFVPGTILGAGNSVSKSTPNVCIDGGYKRMVDNNQTITWMTATSTPRSVLWRKGKWTLRGCNEAPNSPGGQVQDL